MRKLFFFLTIFNPTPSRTCETPITGYIKEGSHILVKATLQNNKLRVCYTPRALLANPPINPHNTFCEKQENWLAFMPNNQYALIIEKGTGAFKNHIVIKMYNSEKKIIFPQLGSPDFLTAQIRHSTVDQKAEIMLLQDEKGS